MDKKIKVARSYTFEAYDVTNVNELQVNKHEGTFIYKSECHYYVEKYIRDKLKANNNNNIYAIYKVSTQEDNNVDDLLIETIALNNNDMLIINIYN